ncbi:serine hydrolase [Rhizobium sp. LCM 4573]|uniref:serine hydrolase domain-containing protein n=1 Tax=Rhizobium sp. LCM 4573 TaxID=1848291 RepID=UPI0008D8DF5D|nr:serine hydrolase [Rhizobium sp. LCM 4573]OHV84214.1 6-aminohexanoate hydrolase [Rhizobium sp. LCM 4573]
MRIVARLLKIGLAILLVCIIGLLAWLHFVPPALLRVGSGYSAKIVCSNVFLAGRDEEDVLAVDVQAPGHPLLRLMWVTVDREKKSVHAALLGFIAGNDAVYRDGLGCTVTPDGSTAPMDVAMGPTSALEGEEDLPWPEGEGMESNQAVARILSDAALTGPGMRAVVVIKNGRIVGEAYGTGFSSDTPLLGWSITKSVNAAIIGTLIRDGRLSLEERNLFPKWQGDERGAIRLADLLAMESGLAFNENYGTVADVTRMLYLESDMAGFAADAILEAPPGTRFNYSSGTSVMLSRIWISRIGDERAALAYPRGALFAPLGMTSAVMEPDAAGTFVGSSYMYATARDWARFALLLLRDGVWNGKRLLPEGFVAMMRQPNGTTDHYSRMQTWLAGSDDEGVPADTFFLQGHDGQTIAIIPSLDMAVIRLGLTPRWNGYDPDRLIAEMAKALP